MIWDVPQSRERTIFIGVRKDIDKRITFPVNRVDFDYVSCQDATMDIVNTKEEIEESTHSEGIVKGYVLKLKEGESGSKYAPSGYHGLYRLKREFPCPTITARQGNKGACLIHWEEDRELTISDLKRLSSFPDDYYLGDKYTKKTERIGRAVPPLMMKGIAEHVYETILKE